MDFVPHKALSYLTSGKELNRLVSMGSPHAIRPHSKRGALQYKEKYSTSIACELKNELNSKTCPFKKPRRCDPTSFSPDLSPS